MSFNPKTGSNAGVPASCDNAAWDRYGQQVREAFATVKEREERESWQHEAREGWLTMRDKAELLLRNAGFNPDDFLLPPTRKD